MSEFRPGLQRHAGGPDDYGGGKDKISGLVDG